MMNGKHAATLALLAMCRKAKDSETMHNQELNSLPAELRIVGRAILDEDISNAEAGQYIVWADSLSYRKK
jgi:hypothetical protein